MARHTRFDPSEPLHIFQDDLYENQQAPLISYAPMPSAAKSSRRALQNSNSNRNFVFNPPNMPATHQSPFKSALRSATSPTTPLKASQSNKLNMVSFNPPLDPLKSTDGMPKKQPLMSRFKTVAQKPTADMGRGYMGKENAHPIIFPAPSTLNLSIESYYQKPHGKRLLEPAPIKDARPQKKSRLDDGPLPPHDSFPPIVDDGSKPGHSYAMLIGMAILRTPNRRLTLSQIYKWISDNYSFYNPQEAGWQNSIRHNLSLNKAFIKQERPKDDPGKGNYWAIEPGLEHQFMKEKPTRKSITAENVPVMSTLLEPSLSQPHSFLEPSMPPQLPEMPHNLPALPPSPVPAPLQPEASSDATIPISDNATVEELDKLLEHDIPLDSGMFSPLPAAMHSSPPIPRILETSSGTPTASPRAAASSATRSHRRKIASMDDSGYISSLESSVLRSNQNGRLPTSEADRPRIKRGRAEEEIARLRASSYDSPTKGRSWNGFAPPSSSPLRQGDCGQMLPPLTPAVKFKAPPRPPPSASPNTDLRVHRDRVRNMLASPLRRIPNDSDGRMLWGSPVPHKARKSLMAGGEALGSSYKAYVPGATTFEIFQDDLTSLFPDAMTPEQPSIKRLRLDRSQSTSVLTDVTNSGVRRSLTSAPFLKLGQSPALGLDTPSKFFDNLPSSPSKLFMAPSPSKLPALDDENSWISLDDYCNTDLIQDPDDFGGLDMLQGFEKIGATTQPPRPTRGAHKPPFGRSYTSNF